MDGWLTADDEKTAKLLADLYTAFFGMVMRYAIIVHHAEQAAMRNARLLDAALAAQLGTRRLL